MAAAVSDYAALHVLGANLQILVISYNHTIKGKTWQILHQRQTGSPRTNN